MKNSPNTNNLQTIIYNSMIITSSLMIVSSIATAIGIVLWIENANFTTGYSSEAQSNIASTGSWMGIIGGIITILLSFISIALFIERIILAKRFKNTPSTPKSVISMVLFITSWLPLLTVILIEIFK